jgi:hypothetical protein
VHQGTLQAAFGSPGSRYALIEEDLQAAGSGSDQAQLGVLEDGVDLLTRCSQRSRKRWQGHHSAKRHALWTVRHVRRLVWHLVDPQLCEGRLNRDGAPAHGAAPRCSSTEKENDCAADLVTKDAAKLTLTVVGDFPFRNNVCGTPLPTHANSSASGLCLAKTTSRGLPHTVSLSASE